jgi:NADPH-dependent curcumin reductase CurA
MEKEEMNRVVGENKMRFVDLVDKVFDFARAEEAFGYLWEGRHVGKVVIEL